MKFSITKLFDYIVGLIILWIICSVSPSMYFHHFFYYTHHQMPSFFRMLFEILYYIPKIILLVSSIGIFYRKEWARIIDLIILPFIFLLELIAMFGFIIATFSFPCYIIVSNFIMPVFLIGSCFILLFQPSFNLPKPPTEDTLPKNL